MVEPRDNENEDEPSFEKVLEKLGPLGKFQMLHVVLCNVTMFPLAAVLLSFVFQGYAPPYVCNAVNETQLLSKYGLENDTSAKVVYQSCQLKVLANRSGQMDKVDEMDCPNGRNFFDAKHTTFLSEWDLVCESSGVAEVSQTFYNVGQMIGGVIGSYLCDRFGRKPSLIASTLILSLVELAIAAAPNIFFVYGSKLVSGFLYITNVSCYFVYATEMVTPRHREANGWVMAIFWIAGALLTGAIAFFLRHDSWRYYQIAIGVMGVMILAYPFVLSESPRWLAATGRTKEALRVLERASKMNGKDFNEVKETFLEFISHTNSTKQQSRPMKVIGSGEDDEEEVTFKGNGDEVEDVKKNSFIDLFRNRSLRAATLIVWYLFITNYLTYMGLYMTSSTLAGDRFLNFTALTLVELPGAFVVYYTMKHMNRRLVVKVFYGLTVISLMTSTLLDTFADQLDGSTIAITLLFIFGKFAITCSFNVLFILAPELFPTNVRSIAFGFCSGMARPGALLAPFLRPLYEMVKWGPGLIFSVMCLVATFLTFFLPETKDVNLPDTAEDVAEMERKTGNLKILQPTKISNGEA